MLSNFLKEKAILYKTVKNERGNVEKIDGKEIRTMADFTKKVSITSGNDEHKYGQGTFIVEDENVKVGNIIEYNEKDYIIKEVKPLKVKITGRFLYNMVVV